MIGITLEERRMGHEPKGFGKLFSGSPRARALRLLSRQVAGMVSVPFAYHAEEPLNIWNCLAIGHGLSGEGTLFGPYTSTLNAQVLAEDLEEVFTKLKKLEPFWFGAHQPAALARKVCYEKVMVFVAQNG